MGIGRAIDDRLGWRAPLRRALRKLFPTHWSFLLGEITLFSFLGLLLSGIYLGLFYAPGLTPTSYHGAASSFAGRSLPEAFASVLALSVDVPMGLVIRRFHHFAAHLFMASLLLHAARVYFTGAFRRPRELTWWIGIGLFALGLINGFSGYVLPFDMRGGTALRMMMTTLESIPWVGGWLASLAFGGAFPGPLIVHRLYLVHVFLGPALITLLIALHLYLIVRLSHTNYPAPSCSDRLEVGAPLWPAQAARSTTLVFLVFAATSLAAAFFPVEAVEVYGPFQPLSSYAPLSPDWFLMWIEGAFRLLPRQLEFRLLGATWSTPFYGAVVLPMAVFAGLVLYPLVDAQIYRYEPASAHLLESWRSRPLRTAIGVSGLSFLTLLSCAVTNRELAAALDWEVWEVNGLFGAIVLIVPPLVFVATLRWLRRQRRLPAERPQA